MILTFSCVCKKDSLRIVEYYAADDQSNSRIARKSKPVKKTEDELLVQHLCTTPNSRHKLKISGGSSFFCFFFFLGSRAADALLIQGTSTTTKRV
jgi:hypothetical protein